MTGQSQFVEFEAEDLEQRDPRSLAEYLQVSRAFVQLCFDAGFPVGSGGASAAELLGWLSHHYQQVRQVAGLSPLDDDPERTLLSSGKIGWASAVLTLLDFGVSRASNGGHRGKLLSQKQRLDRALTRARVAKKRLGETSAAQG
jgi:hypothetical protein